MKTNGVDFNRVAMFVDIVEAHGVSAAATKLRLPKSSVSRGLSQLEAELGVELVVRGGRRFQLTDSGRAFFDSASRAITTVNDARAEIRSETMAPRGRVRISAPPTLSTWLVAPVVTRFVREFPEVDVEISATGRNVDPVRDGFDIVVAVGKLPDSSAKVRSLGRVDAGIYASPTYLRERGTPRRPSDLARHECIMHGPATDKSRWSLTGASGDVEVSVAGRIRVDDTFTAIGVAAMHGGLAVLPMALSHIDATAAALVRVLPDYVVKGDGAHVLYPSSRHVPQRVRLLIDALAAVATTSCTEVPQEIVAVQKLTTISSTNGRAHA